MSTHRTPARVAARSSAGPRRGLLIGCALLAGVSLHTPASAAPDPDTTAAPRYLAGHLFTPSTLVPDPFIATSFATTTAGGRAVNLKIPIYNLRGDQINEVSGDMGFVLLEFNYEQRLATRYALRIAVNGGARLGTTPPSFLADGVSSIFGYGLGGSMRLVEKHNWQLAGTLDLRSNSLTTVSPVGIVKSAFEQSRNNDTTGAVIADSLLETGNNLRVLIGGRAAYAPAPWVGLTAFVEGGLGQRFQEAGNLGVINLGFAADFDMNPLRRLPIGFLVSFRSESLTERSEDIGGGLQSYGFGVFYTGRRWFSLGLENTYQRLDQVATGSSADIVQSRIVMRYDFN